MKHLLAFFLVAAVAPAAALAQTDPGGALPVDRIPPAAHGAWEAALLLTNEATTVVLEPASGRIVELTFGEGSNVLHAAEPEGGEGLRVAGGTGITWSAHAWITGDGVRHARMRGKLGQDGTAAVTRELAIGKDTSTLTVRQEVEGTPIAAQRAGLYHAVRLPSPDRMVLPIDAASQWEEGFKLLEIGDGQHVLNRCEGAVVLDGAFGGRYTIGTDSPEGWTAAVAGSHLILVRVAEGTTGGTLRDGVCRLRVVNDRAAGYSEIHLAGPGTGGNTLEISRHPLPGELAPCELAAYARRLNRKTSAAE